MIRHWQSTKTIPPSLYLTNVEDIKQLVCTWHTPIDENETSYSTYEAPKELHAWIQQFFDFDVIVNYQIIHGQIPVHIDYGRTIYWNYIIDTGGTNIVTRFWNLEETEIIQEFECKLHEWYELDVSQKHDVSYVEGYRIGLSVFKLEPNAPTHPVY